MTHLPIVAFANDFEEVEVGGPGTGGRENTVSICKIVKPGPEIKSRLLFHFEGGQLSYRELSYSQASSPLKNAMFSQPKGGLYDWPCTWGPHNQVNNR